MGYYEEEKLGARWRRVCEIEAELITTTPKSSRPFVQFTKEKNLYAYTDVSAERLHQWMKEVNQWSEEITPPEINAKADQEWRQLPEELQWFSRHSYDRERLILQACRTVLLTQKQRALLEKYTPS